MISGVAVGLLLSVAVLPAVASSLAQQGGAVHSGVVQSSLPTTVAQASQTSSVESLLSTIPNTNSRWRVNGGGEMRWFGFSIYGARLWVPNQRWEPEKPYALELTYRRDISADRLVQTSIDEIERLGEKDSARLKAWRSALVGVFPAVQENDVIVGVHVPGQGARFFFNGKPTGQLNDVQLAAAFFSIWLDPRTRAPELRTRLLALERE